jgi:hypothetical protein
MGWRGKLTVGINTSNSKTPWTSVSFLSRKRHVMNIRQDIHGGAIILDLGFNRLKAFLEVVI